VRFDHVARSIVNANHGIMRAEAVFGVSDCVIRFGVPEATEWQRIGDQIDTAFIFARVYFINVL